jgi:VCBS repeat-containing protein
MMDKKYSNILRRSTIFIRLSVVFVMAGIGAFTAVQPALAAQTACTYSWGGGGSSLTMNCSIYNDSGVNLLVWDSWILFDNHVNPDGTLGDSGNIGSSRGGLAPGSTQYSNAYTRTGLTPGVRYYWAFIWRSSSGGSQTRIDYNAVFAPPSASDTSSSGYPNQAQSGSLSISDAASDIVACSVSSSPSHGTLNWCSASGASGSWYYTPNTNWAGVDSFTYRVYDVGGDYSGYATVTFYVNNRSPGALADSYTTDEDTPVSDPWPGVMRNDSDPDNQPLSASLYSAPSHGALTLNSNGSFVYTPAANYYGSDSFSYRVSDGYSDSGVTNVGLTIYSVNDAPVIANANPALITILEDNSGSLEVSASDVEGSGLTFEVYSSPSHGSASFNGSTVNYTPAADYAGPDSFSIRVGDGVAYTTLLVNVTVTPVNDVPVFTKGSDQMVNEDPGLVSIGSWVGSFSHSGGSDENGQTLTFYTSNNNTSLFSQPPAVASDGTLTYRPADNAHGTAVIIIYLKDNGGTDNGGVDTAPEQTFSITVNQVNDAPVLDTGGSPAVIAIDEDDTANTGMLVSATLATGANGDPVSDVDDHPAEGIAEGIAVIGVDNSHGQWQYSTDSGVNWTAFGSPSTSDARLLAADAGTRLRFMPVSDWNGVMVQAVTFRAWDQKPGSGSNGETADIGAAGTGFSAPFSAEYEFASFTVNPVNDAPVLDDSVTMSLSAIAEDEVTDGTLISQIIASAETHGEDRITDVDQNLGVGYYGEGIAVYAADGAHGSWEYSTDNGVIWNPLGDVSQTSARLLVSNNFTRLRFLPVVNWNTEGWGSALPTVNFVAWDRSSGLNGGLADTSTTGGIMSFSTTGQSASISLLTLNDRPTFTRGSDLVIDEDSAAQTYAFWATNISPGPQDETAYFHQQTHFNIIYVTRPELFTAAGQPQLGVDGTLTFTPAEEAYGEATVILELQDDGGTLLEGSQDTSTFNYLVITFNAVNDAPSFTKGADITVAEDTGGYSQPSWATALDKGPENESWQELSFIVTEVSNPGLFDPVKNGVSPAVDPDGALTFRPADNANGSATIQIKLHDSGGTLYGGGNESAITSFTITVDPANDAPVNSALPLVSGLAYVNETLSGTDGAWNDGIDLAPGNLNYTYQWQRAADDQGAGLSDISGATAAQYQLTLDDSGKYLRLQVTAADDGEGLPASQSSLAYSLYIRVESANLEVSVTGFAKSQDEDLLLAFAVSDFTDHYTQITGGPLERIIVTALPLHGTLFIDGNANKQVDAGEAAALSLEILAADLDRLAYLPDSDWNGSDSFKWNATDALANGWPLPGSGVAVGLTVNAVNDAPALVVPPGLGVHEDTDSLPFTFSVTDVDVELTDPVATDYEAWLADDFGTFSLASTTGLTFISGADDSKALTVTGSLADLQAAFAGLVYHPMPGYTGQDNLTVGIKDHGNSGLGEPLSAQATTIILISDANNAPINVLPAPFTVDVNTTSLPMDFEFMDDSNSYMQITFAAEHGSLLIPDTSNMTLLSGANASHAMTYRGPVLKVIKALQKLTYRPDADYVGPDTISFTTDDLGGTGTGGARSDTDTLDVIVNAPPVVQDDEYYTGWKDTLVQPAPGLLLNDSDFNLDPITATLVTSPAVGSLTLHPDGSFEYAPTLSYTGDITFTYSISDGRLNSEIAEALISVEGDMAAGLSYEYIGDDISYTFTVTNPTEHRVFTGLQLAYDLGAGGELLSVHNGSYEPAGGAYGNGVVRSLAIPEAKPGDTFVMTWTVRKTGTGAFPGSWSFDTSVTHQDGELPVTLGEELKTGLTYQYTGDEITYTFTVTNSAEYRTLIDLEYLFNLGAGGEVLTVTNGTYEATGGEFGNGLIRSAAIPEVKPGHVSVMSWTVRVTGSGDYAGSWSAETSVTHAGGQLTVDLGQDLETGLTYRYDGDIVTFTFTVTNPNEVRVFKDLQLTFNIGADGQVLVVTNGAYEATGGAYGNGLIRSAAIPLVKPGDSLVITWAMRINGFGTYTGGWQVDTSATHLSGDMNIYQFALPIIIK